MSVAIATLQSLAAQNNSPSPQLTVLHTFSGQSDGAVPLAEVVRDAAGNVYGTAAYGGSFTNCSVGCGVVFKIDTRGQETPLYTFMGQPDGQYPLSGLVRDGAGRLYSTTSQGGASDAGTVFELSPYPNVCATVLCPWHEVMLHSFDITDGESPGATLVLDPNGSLYGTTANGGTGNCNSGCGTVFSLDSQGQLNTLHDFSGPPTDGASPSGRLSRGADGNYYGTTLYGGIESCSAPGEVSCGVMFRVDNSGNETVVYMFPGGASGAFPNGALVADAQGNFYGTTLGGGLSNSNCLNSGCGVVFELTSTESGWTETVLYSFTGGTDGGNPLAGLVRDSQGNLYGTTSIGGIAGGFCNSQCGVVFELMPTDSGWTQSVLWSFTGGADGNYPEAALTLDEQNNLYGTTFNGGDLSDTNPACLGLGCGVVFKLTH
jgi:uncharacterized repeat protein (TIGR03803 family)